MSDVEYYYQDASGGQAGPVSKSKLIDFVKNKTLTSKTLVWAEGMDSWTAVQDIPALYAAVSTPPPPPKPSPPPVTRSRDENQTSSKSRSEQSTHAPIQRSASLPSENDRSWVEKFTADGVAYYYNTQSESVSWDKPDCLKTADEKQQEEGEWVWVTDPKEVWVPARIKSRHGNTITVALLNGSKKTITTAPDEPLWPLLKSSLTRHVEDMVMVESLNYAQMMHLLKSRYNQDEIYTWVGASHSVLVSINPFKQLPIYTVNTMAEFAHASPNRLDPPHTFAIANSAFQNMSKEGLNQAILISGESGAGKTEATKQCFNFLAEVAGSDLQLEQKILNANPILEAFGNAKTLRNNNSSRFGRWTEINFSSRGQIIGASIENYLLEKSRVVRQSQGERSYHIFYQLCGSMAGPLSLTSPMAFRYLNSSGCITADGVNDKQDFDDVITAFSQLGFNDGDTQWVFECCSGILHLGNITFSQKGEGSIVSGAAQNALNLAATFLKVDVNRLGGALCARTIEVRGELNHILHDPTEAVEAADALSKAIYNQLFNWLVKRINESVKGAKGNFIGVLDIFGFEIFQQNGFEQLCINFTNEKLQQHFNAHTFKEEEQTYMSEEVPYDPVTFIDNQPVLDLIEKKPYGLLNMLDEEVKLPKGDDAKWLEKCSHHHANHPNWVTDQMKLSQLGRSSFYVRHYAGEVVYDSAGFCEKNKDSLFRDLYDLMSSATHPNFSEIFPQKDKNPRRVETLGGGFRKQLSNLMQVCEKTQPHYIRCIKPNEFKAAGDFNTKMCLEQLTYAGVFEAVQIRKTGYPFRLPHGRFAGRYRPLLKKKTGRVSVMGSQDMVAICESILSSVPQDFSKVAIGNTMILYRAEEHRVLELLRNLCLDRVIPYAQRKTREYIGRQFRQALRLVHTLCQEAIADGNDADLFDEMIEKSQTAIAPFRMLFNYEPHPLKRARDIRFRLQERVELNKEFRRLARLDCMEHFDAFTSAVVRSDKIADMPGTAEDIAVESVVRDKLRSAASGKIDAWAHEVLDLLDKKQMELVSAEAAKYAYHSMDIVEINALLALPEEKFVRKQLQRANEIGDKDRVINREIRLKYLFLDMYGSLFEFGPGCTAVRNAQDWASTKFFGIALNKAKLAMGMLTHTEYPIHQSLTVMNDPGESKEAVKAFKNLMGYMGDRKYSYPDTLAAEYLATGISGSAGMRAELYLQLMKQLSENDCLTSESKGWEMFALMLSCFPPPETVENFVAMFLRKNAPKANRHRYSVFLQCSMYEKQVRQAPATAELPALLAEFHTRPIDEKFESEDIIRPSSSPSGAYSPPSPAPGFVQDGYSVGSPGGAPPPPPPPPKAPPRPPPSAQPRYQVTYDYDSVEDGMMTIKAGEELSVTDCNDGDWWNATKLAGANVGQSGWVPAAYLQKM